MLYSCTWFFLFCDVMGSSDTLAMSHDIKDNETLVSSSGTTEVGFFSPGNSTRRYLGIWYKNVSPLTVVWVANRQTPLHNNEGVLKLNEKGILVLLNATKSTIWSSNISSTTTLNNPTAQLLDSGNLVVKNGHETKEDNFLWQSFDHPSDTLLPGMKLGWNLETGLETTLTSWTGFDDPAQGKYSIKMDLRGYPQVILFNGLDIKTRIGPWNGDSLVGYPDPTTTSTSQIFVFNEKELYYGGELLDRSVLIAYTLTPSGIGESFYLTIQTGTRRVFATGDQDQCENYARCGANSICSIDGNHPTCECLKGYVPKFPKDWNLSLWSDGCVPRNKSNCKTSYTDGFFKYTHIKLPDTSSSRFNKTMNLDQCRKSCLNNCSCVAYANLDIRDRGSGCLLWFNNLVDLRKFSQWGQDFYIRVPASELGAARKFCSKHYKIKPAGKEDFDLPTFDLSVLANATENFSSNNKLGQGGFGPVYKGTLVNGEELAVKKLSKKSGQGFEEFKNEVALIAKLQHRNLVKLLGCCIEGEDKMLIYEYMPNKSLDYFIFDETKRKLLDWPKRFNIISCIARGILYLHQDSRLRIIHRDLKTSNILLDSKLDAKISDFGLARTLLGDQVEANTNRVVGTYGYISPEYAVHGHFSTKSDIFSYGVIVLEIISGKKNRDFWDAEYYHNLLGYAWRLWNEERALELLDEVLGEECTASEVKRCIQTKLVFPQESLNELAPTRILTVELQLQR
ncbi:hypothetical protein RJT34_32074 [Clitoria ternatea]|uniref:Receptor-like serine/threonine-protein kinase n=1 Tax=Clitoria ternatea TaxID=43366 RepID=A0AAN9EZL9_CLITE